MDSAAVGTACGCRPRLGYRSGLGFARRLRGIHTAHSPDDGGPPGTRVGPFSVDKNSTGYLFPIEGVYSILKVYGLELHAPS